MKEYNLEFSHYFVSTDNFKEKNARILVATIAGARLNDYMKFSCFAHIDFNEEDTRHQFPHVTEFDKYNRTKTNCIVYDLTDLAGNEFDKCFIYRTAYPHTPMYGLVFYNSETGKCNHIYNIEEDCDNICSSLMQSFNTRRKKIVYDYYAKVYNSSKGRYGLTIKDCPDVAEYNEMMKSLEETKNRYAV